MRFNGGAGRARNAKDGELVSHSGMVLSNELANKLSVAICQIVIVVKGIGYGGTRYA